MTVRNTPAGPLTLQAASMNADVLRQAFQSLVAAPGIVGPGDLAVTANGTPNMSVNVAAGFGFIAGTQQSPGQGIYHAYNDGTVNLAVAASDGTNPRNDLVVLTLQDSAYSGAANQAVLQVVTGTPAPTPGDPTVPANSITLARVAVGAGASSITSGNITDLRATAITRNRERYYEAPGLGGTVGATESGIVTVTIPAQGFPYIVKLEAELYWTQTVTTDSFDAIVRSGSGTGGAMLRRSRGSGGYYTASIRARSTVNPDGTSQFTLTLVRVTGTGTASPFSDQTLNYLAATIVPL